ncbi:MAG: MEDS domain-containing protein, partial [Anaerolineae bacterium]
MTQNHTSRAIVDLRPGDHFGFLYETEKEHQAVLTSFLRQGLERDEKIVYVLDTHDVETILDYLRDVPLVGTEPGPDVEFYLASGQLTFLDGDNVHAQCAALTPQDIISHLQALTAQALAEGY